MRKSIALGWLGAALALAACERNPYHLNDAFLQLHAAPDPSPAGFFECHGFGCAESARVNLTEADWLRVRGEFTPASADAKSERRQIVEAVALTQRLVGAQTGTGVHQWTHDHMMIRPNFGDPSQLDCIDEAVNTWTYLTLMERDGLLRFHRVAGLSYAGTLFDLDMRNTAVLQATGSGEYFAVDPSLVDSAVPPPVMPLSVWLGSWPPNLPDAAADTLAQSRR